MKWKCDKCKGEKVTQEWSVFRPMNDLSGGDLWDDWWQKLDSFWCEDCDEVCSPEKEEMKV
jgi:hypothetical protein